MADDPLALATIPAAWPQDADYDAVYAAVTATERGRWFLAEYASRNRHADTDAVLAALARIEAAVGTAQAGPQHSTQTDIAAAVDKVADIAFQLRERSAEAALCDALDAAVREMAQTDDARVTPRNDPRLANAFLAVGELSGTRVAPAPDDARVAVAVPSPQWSSEAAPAVKEPATSILNRVAVETIKPPQDVVLPGVQAPPDAVSNNPRWHIEAPDFVFEKVRPLHNGHAAADPVASMPPVQMLLADPDDDPAGLFDEGRASGGELPAGSVEPRQPVPPLLAATATSDQAAPAQISAANGAVNGVALRVVPPHPLAAIRALNEEETIALFG